MKIVPKLQVVWMTLLALASGSQANTIDATTGPSIHVVQGSTTTTTAIFQWQESRPNGHLCHFWDSTNTNWKSMRDSMCWSYYAVQTSSGWIVRVRQNKDTIRNLVPGTTYHYVLQGFYPALADGSFPEVPVYSTSGTFTTSGSSAILPPHRMPLSEQAPWDALGRPGQAFWNATPQGTTLRPPAGKPR